MQTKANSGNAAHTDVRLRERATLVANDEHLRVNEFERNLPETTRHLLHELRLHQLELEMQNESLRQTQEQLTEEKQRYFRLYDLAPVAYCTINEAGVILQANQATARLFGMLSTNLVKRRFSRFLMREDHDLFFLMSRAMETNSPAQRCDVRMLNQTSDTLFWAQIEVAKMQESEQAADYRIIICDITERRQASQQLIAGHAAMCDAVQNTQILLDRMTERVCRILHTSTPEN